MAGRLRGKVALITGGGTGIGAGTALAFAAEGADVAICGRRPRPLESTVDAIRAAGHDALAIPADLTAVAGIEDVVARVEHAFGPVTVLFNNAATGDDEPILHEISVEAWDHIVATNLTAVARLSAAVIPGMLRVGGGSIINNASRIAVQGLGGYSAYTASKGGLLALTRSMAVEYAEHGIRVNAINPGLVVTAMGESLMAPYVSGEKPMWERAPLGRLGTPADIAWGAVYLASDESAWVTGITLPIDGGRGIL